MSMPVNRSQVEGNQRLGCLIRNQQNRINELRQEINSLRQELTVTKQNNAQLSETKWALRKSLFEEMDINKQARDDLVSAQSQIFNLQPYRRDLTAQEVKQEYENLVDSIQDLIGPLLDPWFDLDSKSTSLAIAERSANLRTLQLAIFEYPDLVSAAAWPNMDEDILLSLVMRYLNAKLFSTELYGVLPQLSANLQGISTHKLNHTTPLRDELTVRNWQAEAFNATYSSPDFSASREMAGDNLVSGLLGLLGPFDQHPSREKLKKDLELKCVKFAMTLYEKMQVSSDMFNLDIDFYHPRITTVANCQDASNRFYQELGNLNCKNLMNNMRKFTLGIPNHQTSDQIRENVRNVCSTVPAVVMYRPGEEDSPPLVVCQQRNVVAVGSFTSFVTHQNQGQPSLLSRVLFMDELAR